MSVCHSKLWGRGYSVSQKSVLCPKGFSEAVLFGTAPIFKFSDFYCPELSSKQPACQLVHFFIGERLEAFTDRPVEIRFFRIGHRGAFRSLS